MKVGRKAREIWNFSVACERQLNAYALAAATAGVSLLALSQPSEAKIIYTRTHHVIGDGDSYRLDLTGTGTTDLIIQNKYSQWCTTLDGGCWRDQSLAANMSGSNQAVHNFFGAVAMKQGMQIGPKGAFKGGLEVMALLRGYPVSITAPLGSWLNVKDRYLGVKFAFKGQTHYGWARLNVEVQPPLTITATLTGYACETIANKAIIAGKTKGPDVITVQPGSLGWLALGRK